MKYNSKLNNVAGNNDRCSLQNVCSALQNDRCSYVKKNFIDIIVENAKIASLSNYSRGFTLIEITVVIILVAIAGSLVLMNIGQSGRMKESRMFAEKIVSLCKKARTTALTNGVPACMTISPEERVCSIGFVDGSQPYIENKTNDSPNYNSFNEEESDNSSSADSNRDHLKIPENILLEGENIKVDSNGTFYICFYPDGSSGGGILTVSSENEFEFTFQVDILTGSISEVISN